MIQNNNFLASLIIYFSFFVKKSAKSKSDVINTRTGTKYKAPMRGGHTNAMTRNLLNQSQSNGSSSVNPIVASQINILQATTSSGAMNPPVNLPSSNNNLNTNTSGIRYDPFRTRTPNTSRPPSVHVDDFYRMESANAQKQQQHQQQQVQAPTSHPQQQPQPQPQQQQIQSQLSVPSQQQTLIQNIPHIHAETNKNLITLNANDGPSTNTPLNNLPHQAGNVELTNKNTTVINIPTNNTISNNNNSNSNSINAIATTNSNNATTASNNSNLMSVPNFPIRPIQTINSQNQPPLQQQQQHSINSIQPLQNRPNNFENNKTVNAVNSPIKNELLPTPNLTNLSIKNTTHENLIQIELNNNFPKNSSK